MSLRIQKIRWVDKFLSHSPILPSLFFPPPRDKEKKGVEWEKFLSSFLGANQDLRDYSGKKARQYVASQEAAVSQDTFRSEYLSLAAAGEGGNLLRAASLRAPATASLLPSRSDMMKRATLPANMKNRQRRRPTLLSGPSFLRKNFSPTASMRRGKKAAQDAEPWLWVVAALFRTQTRNCIALMLIFTHRMHPTTRTDHLVSYSQTPQRH